APELEEVEALLRLDDRRQPPDLLHRGCRGGHLGCKPSSDLLNGNEAGVPVQDPRREVVRALSRKLSEAAEIRGRQRLGLLRQLLRTRPFGLSRGRVSLGCGEESDPEASRLWL